VVIQAHSHHLAILDVLAWSYSLFLVNGVCVGESESLRMKSRGDEDTALIAQLLDIDGLNEDLPTVKGFVEHISKNKAKRLRKQARR